VCSFFRITPFFDNQPIFTKGFGRHLSTGWRPEGLSAATMGLHVKKTGCTVLCKGMNGQREVRGPEPPRLCGFFFRRNPDLWSGFFTQWEYWKYGMMEQ
jgi:hypothetical protein